VPAFGDSPGFQRGSGGDIVESMLRERSSIFGAWGARGYLQEVGQATRDKMMAAIEDDFPF
jgi:hypothetical protein